MEKSILISNKPSSSRAHIKRPMNSFMVWSREKRCEILKKHPGINNAVVSKTLGAAWKSLSEEEKKPYVYEAQRLAEQHRDEHPEYKYRPRRRKSRMKINEHLEEPKVTYMPTHHHHHPSNKCMCHAAHNAKPHSSTYPNVPITPRCPETPQQHMYSPFYGCVSSACCSGERVAYSHREKTSADEFIEQQEILRLKQIHYNRELEMRYRDFYKTPCTKGCCSPTEDYYRYYKYASYPKEGMPY